MHMYWGTNVLIFFGRARKKQGPDLQKNRKAKARTREQ